MAFIAPTVLPKTAGVSASGVCQRTAPTAKLDASSSDKLARVAAAALAAVVVAASPLVPEPADASLFHIRGDRPSDLGIKYDRYLSTCPPTPNCISSSANVYDKHYVPSWTYNIEKGAPGAKDKSMEEAVADLNKVLEEYPRVEVIKNEAVTTESGKGHYIYAEFESKLMGYIDDVEFLFRSDNDTVEYRSASRLGESDFDANRKRIRDLRKALQVTDARWGSTGY